MLALLKTKIGMFVAGATVLAVVATGLYVRHLRSLNESLALHNIELTLKNDQLAASIEKMAADHNRQISNLQALEKARSEAASTGQQFLLRLDEIDLTKEPTDDQTEDPIFGLNRLNADANRLLEQTTR